MWEAFGGTLKVFLEKHLIPTVISIVSSIIILLFLPENNWMVKKIGEFTLLILVACSVFLLVEFVIVCYKKMREIKSRSDTNSYYDREIKDDEKKVMDQLWTRVDSLSPSDKEIIKQFLANGNSPIERTSNVQYFGDSLLNSNWVVSTQEYREVKREEIHLTENQKRKGIAIDPIILAASKSTVVKYKLREEIYTALKHSEKIYNRISHFE